MIWGDLGRRWISRSLRNEIIQYVSYWQERTGKDLAVLLKWLSISKSKFYQWKQRQETENKVNKVPKSHWLLAWEIAAIIKFKRDHFDEGYRRLTYMDQNIVAVSPSAVYRILKREDLLQTQWRHKKAKGSGFIQPISAHEHWHLDITYINFKGTFVYLVVLIDGYSRYIVHHEVKLSVEALDIEIMMERALAKFPGKKPILITDNGPQFIANDFKDYLKTAGLTHRRTRFFYPQSNGKVERVIQTAKNEAVRRFSFLDLGDLMKQIQCYVTKYNEQRLHSSIGYITPIDMLDGKQKVIFAERSEKLKMARENRLANWVQINQPDSCLGGLQYA
jgi:transposase InsO family protein